MNQSSSSTLRSTFFQLGRYTVAGGTALATHVAVLSLLVELTPINKTLASAVGFACAVPVNYSLQHRFVFNSRGMHGVRFVRYVLVTLSTMTLNALAFWTLAEILHVYYVTAQLTTTALIFMMNFVVNRFYTFADLDR